MSRFVTLLALVSLLLPISFSSSVSAADDVIVFATEAAYPPFNERAADGTIIGWEIDLGMEMCKRINRECKFIAQEWDGIIPGLLAKKYDAIFAAMTITKGRAKIINFTNKHFHSPSAFVGREGDSVDFSDKTLGGLAIGTYPGTTQCYLESHYPNADFRIYKTAQDLALDANAGRIDLMVADMIQAEFGIMRVYPEQKYAFIGEPLVDPECFGEGAGIGVRKKDTELLELLNKAIDMVRADGTYQRLSNEYFGFDIYGD